MAREGSNRRSRRIIDDEGQTGRDVRVASEYSSEYLIPHTHGQQTAAPSAADLAAALTAAEETGELSGDSIISEEKASRGGRPPQPQHDRAGRQRPHDAGRPPPNRHPARVLAFCFLRRRLFFCACTGCVMLTKQRSSPLLCFMLAPFQSF